MSFSTIFSVFIADFAFKIENSGVDVKIRASDVDFNAKKFHLRLEILATSLIVYLIREGAWICETGVEISSPS